MPPETKKSIWDPKFILTIVLVLVTSISSYAVLTYRVGAVETSVKELKVADSKMATQAGMDKLELKLDDINKQIVKLLVNAGIQP